MTDDFVKNYRILGVQQGVNWKQLRQAYKKLVNTWHPDRFQDIHQKKRAEEKTKEITQSYKALAEYHKEFGVLPFAGSSTEIPVAKNVASQSTSDTPPVPESRNPDLATVITSAPAQKSRLSSVTARVITAAALASIAYIIWQLEASMHHGNLPATTENVKNQATDGSSIENPNPDAGVSNKLFTLGSSLGEVYTIQGVPTRTEDDIWYYGKSRVYFSKGKVFRWNENPENPLRVKIIAETEKSHALFFGKGSSKEEVLAIQGTPDRDAGSVWDYGASRIYFNNDRVTEWHETPLNPLKIRH